jgi:C4-dicarboxylate-specific signal transduction histidine kinase
MPAQDQGGRARGTRRRERQYREVQIQLAHANRVATIGQLSASIAHELKQPLGAVVSNGGATLRWLARNQPEIEEAKQAVECIIKDANRASEVLGRIHRLVKKESMRTDTLDVNDAILEVIPLIQSEAAKNGVTIQRQSSVPLQPVAAHGALSSSCRMRFSSAFVQNGNHIETFKLTFPQLELIQPHAHLCCNLRILSHRAGVRA